MFHTHILNYFYNNNYYSQNVEMNILILLVYSIKFEHTVSEAATIFIDTLNDRRHDNKQTH